MMQLKVHAAKWWEKEEDSKTRCLLCPRRCLIPDGGAGVCAVRLNRGGELVSQAYGYPVALQIDPIEKKPLRHFLPRTGTFSIGTLGCNLKCVFCQNHHLSRAAYQERLTYRYFEPRQIAELAKRHGCASLSFTYNEPTVFGEYVINAANAAHEIGLKTVLVSNAYINREAAKEIYPLMDAANIDVKGFSEEYYREMCGGSLKPVTDAVEFYKNEIGGHVELTYLVIPGKNDADQMIIWTGSKRNSESIRRCISRHITRITNIRQAPALRLNCFIKFRTMPSSTGNFRTSISATSADSADRT